MQGATIAFAPSISLPDSSRKFAAARFSPLPISPSERMRLINAPRLSFSITSSGRKLSPIGCSLKQSGWISEPDPGSLEAESDDGVRVQAAAASAGEAGIPNSKSFEDTLVLGTLFVLWFLFNIYFNIYNKQVLKVFHYPLTVTLVQFAFGAALVTLMWTLNLYKRPKISGAQLAAILPLAVVHTLGNLFTNMSLGKVSVSFTHTIKAMEPFFSVVLSAMFLGELHGVYNLMMWKKFSIEEGISILFIDFLKKIINCIPLLHYGSLPLFLPVVGGVGLASMTEASFDWVGFWSAMASNLTNQSRNVLSKKLMVKKEESLDNITLFSIITIMSFILIAPVALFVEGVKFTPSYLQAAGVNVQQIYTRSLVAALCFHAYQQVSYMILQRVSPVTHSVANCVKRVVVIVTSVLFFRTPVSPINAIGTGIALAGVFIYSRVKRIKPKTA